MNQTEVTHFAMEGYDCWLIHSRDALKKRDRNLKKSNFTIGLSLKKECLYWIPLLCNSVVNEFVSDPFQTLFMLTIEELKT